MKSDEEIMEILEAFDLTRSFRDAGELAACSPNTVAHWVGVRDAGALQIPARREQLIDAFLPKIEEWVDASHGKVRADVAHDKLVALGYSGSARTTRRGVAAAKKAYRDGRRRIYRPWVPEPGMWFQYDFGDGPVVAGVATVLFCAWLSLVEVPDGDPHPGQVPAERHRLHRRHPAPIRRLPHRRTHGQREDGDDHPCGSHRHPQRRHGRRRSPLRPNHRHQRRRRPRVQGWLGGHRAHRQGRPGAHRRQSAWHLSELRRPGGGL